MYKLYIKAYSQIIFNHTHSCYSQYIYISVFVLKRLCYFYNRCKNITSHFNIHMHIQTL